MDTICSLQNEGPGLAPPKEERECHPGLQRSARCCGPTMRSAFVHDHHNRKRSRIKMIISSGKQENPAQIRRNAKIRAAMRQFLAVLAVFALLFSASSAAF